ncbi:Protein K11D9.3 [Aphelenchoides avenae]|nr:Protein K11D9.3 [Aphelenchus avenae]
MTCYNLNRFYVLALVVRQFDVFLGVQKIFAVFTNYVPKWRCTANETFARDCSVYQSCPTPIKFENSDFYSAALEFDWICGSGRHYISLNSQAVFVGVLLGTLLFGYLSDRYGRKRMSVVTLGLGVAAITLAGLAPDWRYLLTARFIVGLACAPMTFIFLMETILPEQRMIVRGFVNWGNARIILTLVCFLFPHWRDASFACAAVIAPALVIIIVFFPESATWLNEKGEFEKARKSEEKIARVGGVNYEEVTRPPKQPHGGMRESLRNPQFVRRLSVLFLMFFTACVSSYANDLNSNSLSGNIFVNQLLFGVIIAFSKLVLVAVDTRFPNFNRRHLHQNAQAGICICFLLLTIMVSFQVNLVHLNAFWAPCTFLLVASIGFVNLLVSYKWLDETRGVSLDHVGLDRAEKTDVERKGVAATEKETMLQRINLMS